jgi:hypothetical protein
MPINISSANAGGRKLRKMTRSGCSVFIGTIEAWVATHRLMAGPCSPTARQWVGIARSNLVHRIRRACAMESNGPVAVPLTNNSALAAERTWRSLLSARRPSRMT